MLYLYAITRSDAPPLPDPADLAGGPLDLLVSGELAAVVGAAERAPPADEATLWRHARLLDLLMADRALLPARFGTLLGEGRLRAVLGRHRATLLADLERLAGCVELSVRGLWPEGEAAPAGPPPPTGRAYMAELLDRERARRARAAGAEAIHAALAPLARAATRGPARAGMPLTAAYLVGRDNVAAFRAAVALADSPGLRLICTGPWPPYSFVTSLEE